jgi:hypothetical protein
MIDHYAFGEITVDGHKYVKDVKIYPDGLIPNWWRREGHELHPEDVPELAAKKPQYLIIGCGAQGVLQVPAATKKYLENLGIPFTTMPTGQAVVEYNRRLAAGEGVAAILHLTC